MFAKLVILGSHTKQRVSSWRLCVFVPLYFAGFPLPGPPPSFAWFFLSPLSPYFCFPIMCILLFSVFHLLEDPFLPFMIPFLTSQPINLHTYIHTYAVLSLRSTSDRKYVVLSGASLFPLT